jgi:hypothetical protein
MALTNCRECGHEISSEAESCPNCGAPNPQKRSKLEGGCSTVLGIIFITFLVLMVVRACSDGFYFFG